MRDRVTEAQLRTTYRNTIDALYGYVSRKSGGQREVAQDITQETWLRAVREWRRTGIPNTPIAWLTTVARNLILNQLRRREGISLEDVSQAEILAAVEQGDVTDSAEIASVVNGALAKIPKEESQLLEAFHFERFKVAQIAEAYGMTERAIEYQLQKARTHLRQEIELTFKAVGDIV